MTCSSPRTNSAIRSMHDQLRALPDHRFFHDCLAIEFEEAQRHLDPLACCIIAVDDFRASCREHGADVAGRVLDEVSVRVQRTIRATDIAAQFGRPSSGSCCPTPGQQEHSRWQIASCPRSRFDRSKASRSASIELTISIGVGLYPSGNIRSHSELLDAASIAVARAGSPDRIASASSSSRATSSAHAPGRSLVDPWRPQAAAADAATTRPATMSQSPHEPIDIRSVSSATSPIRRVGVEQRQRATQRQTKHRRASGPHRAPAAPSPQRSIEEHRCARA